MTTSKVVKTPPHNCLVCLQIIGPKQHDNEKEIQGNQLVGDEVIDSDYAEQDNESKERLRMFGEVTLESVYESGPCWSQQGVIGHDTSYAVHCNQYDRKDAPTVQVDGISWS